MPIMRVGNSLIRTSGGLGRRLGTIISSGQLAATSASIILSGDSPLIIGGAVARTAEAGAVGVQLSTTQISDGTGAASRTLLTSSDIVYQGTFRLPTSGASGDPQFAIGLTHRYVGGQFRLMTKYNSGGLIEFTPATPKTTTTFNAGTVVRDWGDMSGAKRPNGHSFYGIHWDETDQRLYWNTQDAYSTNPNEPVFGYSTLNEGSGVATPYGVWYLPSGTQTHKPIKGMCAIPAIYQSALGGKHLALGFGGYESIAATGSASLGPTLVPADLTTLPAEGGTISAGNLQVLMNNPYNTTAYTQPIRGKRNPNYIQVYDGWHPQNGVGYWTWSDVVKQSAVWIDTGSKQGFLVVCRQATGNESTTFSGRTLISGYQYTIYLDAPLVNVRVGDRIHVPITPYNTYPDIPATVNTITSPTELVITLDTESPEDTPTLATSGTVYRRAGYVSSTLHSTEGRLAGFLYNSDTLITGGYDTDEVPYAEEFFLPSVQPDRIGSWRGEFELTGGYAGVCYGATFDSVTNKLYLLFRSTPTGLGNSGVISVYQVS